MPTRNLVAETPRRCTRSHEIRADRQSVQSTGDRGAVGCPHPQERQQHVTGEAGERVDVTDGHGYSSLVGHTAVAAFDVYSSRPNLVQQITGEFPVMSDVLSGADFKNELRAGKPKIGLFVNSHSRILRIKRRNIMLGLGCVGNHHCDLSGRLACPQGGVNRLQIEDGAGSRNGPCHTGGRLGDGGSRKIGLAATSQTCCRTPRRRDRALCRVPVSVLEQMAPMLTWYVRFGAISTQEKNMKSSAAVTVKSKLHEAKRKTKDELGKLMSDPTLEGKDENKVGRVPTKTRQTDNNIKK